MNPHNRVLTVVGGAAITVCILTAAIYAYTNAAKAALQIDQDNAAIVEVLGDLLVTQVHEQHDALGDYLLSGDPRPLARYREAVADEAETIVLITARASLLPGVAEALEAVEAEGNAWRITVAEPAIGAVESGLDEAVAAAILVQVEGEETTGRAVDLFVIRTDKVSNDIGSRFNVLDDHRAGAMIVGLAIELLAAGLSLWFIRRYGLTVSRDARRRARASAERVQIIASLRTLRSQETPERTAGLIAGVLSRLPQVDVAGVFECTDRGLVALAIVGLPGFPIATGETVPEGHAQYLRNRTAAGPWAERWTRPSEPNAWDEKLATLGIKGRAFAPIEVGGNLVGIVGLATIDDDYGNYLVEDLPAVCEVATLAETILAPALIERRERATRVRTISATIAGGSFRSVFQPVVDLSSGVVVGFEALTRFNDGSRPDATFMIAQECGMGVELETATLESAVSEAKRLPGGAWLSLNVSPALLANGGTLKRLLAEREQGTVLEVTEHEAISSYAPLREAMQEFGPRVRLAVDDVGAGIANFHHLVELRPNFVKIDMSLVRGVDTDPSRRAVVVGLVHFAAEAGSVVIAEGIETEAERTTITSLGVNLGQGYLLGRPGRADSWSSQKAVRASAADNVHKHGLKTPDRPAA